MTQRADIFGTILYSRIPLQMMMPAVMMPAVVLCLCVNFHKCVSVCILRFNFPSYLCSEFYGHDWFQTCRYKTREFWGLSAKVRVFKSLTFFCENAVLNICQYLKLFYTCNKINSIFLKFRQPFFIKNVKNYGNRLNLSCRKTRFKSITNAHINRFGQP